MLEHAHLLLQSRKSLTANPAARFANPSMLWAIFNPLSLDLLGTVHKQRRPRSLWRPWPGRSFIAVYEAEDEPLVCTLQALLAFPGSWEMHDAESQPVGRIRRHSISPWRTRLLTILAFSENQILRFCDPLKQSLGTLTRREDGLLLSFDNEIAEEPFTKMLLLGATLAWHED